MGKGAPPNGCRFRRAFSPLHPENSRRACKEGFELHLSGTHVNRIWLAAHKLSRLARIGVQPSVVNEVGYSGMSTETFQLVFGSRVFRFLFKILLVSVLVIHYAVQYGPLINKIITTLYSNEYVDFWARTRFSLRLLCSA